jgi:uncharacterized protein YuzE
VERSDTHHWVCGKMMGFAYGSTYPTAITNLMSEKMKLRYDSSVDAAYISLAADNNASSLGFTYACDPTEIKGQIHLDFDVSGRLIGIEVLQASRMLPLSALEGRGAQ